jgi:hypothetical protein
MHPPSNSRSIFEPLGTNAGSPVGSGKPASVAAIAPPVNPSAATSTAAARFKSNFVI